MFIIILFLLSIISPNTIILPIKLTSSNTPLINVAHLCPHHPQIFIILDTGSEEFWLADNGCWSCTHTQSFCPQVSSADMAIKYVKGEVEGSYSFINLCGIRKKFFCVKKIKGLGRLDGHGLLGMGGSSTGNSFLEELFHVQNIQKKIVSFYFGIHEHFVMLGQEYGEFTEDGPIAKVEVNKKWQFTSEWVKVLGKKLDKQIRTLVDTGSSKIVFPKQYFTLTMEKIQELYHVKCIQTYEGIACSSVSHVQMNFTISIDGSQVVIPNDVLIDRQKNIFNIICHPSPQDFSIILGFPFLQSYFVSADLSEKTLSLYRYRADLRVSEKINVRIFEICYIIVVIVCVYGCIWLYDIYTEKRSKTIII